MKRNGARLVMLMAVVAGVLLVVSRTHMSAEERAERLIGRTGSLSDFGSGWLDLATPTTFHRGDKLRIEVGGTASRILVRLLPVGFSPDNPDLVVERNIAVPPKDRVITITLGADYRNISQISVHGNRVAFRQFLLGDGNGPATIVSVDHLKR